MHRRSLQASNVSFTAMLLFGRLRDFLCGFSKQIPTKEIGHLPPKPGAGVEEVAFEVVRKDCASSCGWCVLETNNFEIQAFIPRPGASSNKISTVGQFLSVDSRPVSARSGVLKQILTLYKDRLKKLGPNLANVKDPFLYMNIVCPEGSYDSNIEPSKNDVLFEDRNSVFQAVNALFDVFYPSNLEMESSPTSSAGPSLGITRSSEALLEEGSSGQIEDIGSTEYSRCPRSNMYDFDEDDFPPDPEVGQKSVVSDKNNDDDQMRTKVCLNPWTIAALNARPKIIPNPSMNGQPPTPVQRTTERNISPVTPSS
ncbi:hypothetical protein M501DRAFT_273715 [Patellaria atrata CBS 101060]|uniref:DNA mismatch repair protein S5 domain-containing protein n=1 Tax=Patellaria atrata CBS 101060 TaxID=1346257 RepID=A0A9P4S537_9PEZI|nr:hypothetical protein M501DRAFT_273715 [Patellaria atrata CBS 101060]